MQNVIETARKLGCFKVLISVVDAAGLDDALEHGGPLTLFAPTDQAFAKMPVGMVDELMKNPAKLKRILAQHILPGKANAEDLPSRKKVTNALGQDLRIHVEFDGVHVDDARVVEA
ncbi:MAG TPA: fasciclin domain-containing protein, partial [Armatimonadota bacterium]